MRGQGGVGNAWQSKFELQLFEKQILMGFDWDLNFLLLSKFCCENRKNWFLSKFLKPPFIFLKFLVFSNMVTALGISAKHLPDTCENPRADFWDKK